MHPDRVKPLARWTSMDIRALKTTTTNPVPFAEADDLRTEELTRNHSPSPQEHSQSSSSESVIQQVGDADSMFTHAPVSLWEEDFSEVRKRFDQLKRNGIEDLQKYFKKHPEEVLSLARMVRIVRVNNETLALYEAAGPVEFREGLNPIFNKDSFEVFREELMAFWKGRTSFISEAINLTLTGMSKNILIHAIIPPGFEQTWAKVYIAITDITAIRDNIKNLTASELKYRRVFETTQSATVLVDATSGMIVEANKSAKRLLGASSGELAGLHLADLVQGVEQDRVRALMRLHPKRPGLSGQVIHVRNRSNKTIPVLSNTSTIEIYDESVIVVTFTPTEKPLLSRPAGHKNGAHQAGLGVKLSHREREILRLICNGKTSRTIAQHLSISGKTVDTHRTRIMQKLDKHCVADLVKFAMTNGLA
jgi:PAS domain S-box-containing protein